MCLLAGAPYKGQNSEATYLMSKRSSKAMKIPAGEREREREESRTGGPGEAQATGDREARGRRVPAGCGPYYRSSGQPEVSPETEAGYDLSTARCSPTFPAAPKIQPARV